MQWTTSSCLLLSVISVNQEFRPYGLLHLDRPLAMHCGPVSLPAQIDTRRNLVGIDREADHVYREPDSTNCWARRILIEFGAS